jgi:hypothetical protein
MVEVLANGLGYLIFDRCGERDFGSSLYFGTGKKNQE